MALDYGKVRTGIAITDEFKLIASGLMTIETVQLFTFLSDYLKTEQIDSLIVGEPKQMDGSSSQAEELIKPFIRQLKVSFPEIPIYRQDERFTSKMAKDAMVVGGLNKKKRRNKNMVDKISATLILQAYLDRT